MKPIQVTFDEVIESIPWASLRDFSPDVVIGIERGGIVLAAMIANRLGAELRTVRASFYDDSKPARMKYDKPRISLDSLPQLNMKRVLIVDDVSNTGQTLAAVRDLANSYGAFRVNTFVYAGSADFSCRPFEGCLKFPWETEQ